jgi:ribosomal protein S18 acetylase RimI-like enzyme
VPAAEITFGLLDGKQAAAAGTDLAAMHAEVYPAPSDGTRAGAEFGRRFLVQCRQPGFVLAEARSGGYLIGWTAGLPLRPSTSWWRYLTSPLPDEVTSEHPGRTFALVELAVRAAWRRQGIGRSLHDLILAGRPEERATLTVPPAATAAEAAFQSWGWRKVARSQDPGSAAGVVDVLVRSLPVNT